MTGFSSAVHRKDYALAGRYLQTTGRGGGDLEQLAADLSTLLDRYFTQPLSSVSRAPAGILTDGLDPGR